MTSVLSESVAAVICGQNYECKIDRAEIGMFEGLHGSAFAMLSKFQHGIWTERDLLDVLNFSLGEGVIQHAREVGISGVRHVAIAEMLKSRFSPEYAGLSRSPNAQPKTVIEQALRKRGAMRYVPLCIGVLLAALDGLPVDEATFTDEDSDDGKDA